LIPTLTPYRPVVTGPLVRLGARRDGGYVVDARSVQIATILVSAGIGYEWSFEEAFLSRVGPAPVSLVACDASVSPTRFLWRALRRGAAAALSPTRARERLASARWNLERARAFRRFFYGPGRTFHRKFLGTRTGGRSLSIGDLLDRLPAGSGHHIFVKLDVEGDEYDIVPEIVRRAPVLSGLVIEWHTLDHRWEVFTRCMDALRAQFDVVHVHGNNYRPLIPGTGLPAVLEMSFAHKALAGERPLPSRATYPIEGLDWPCNPARPDYPLTFT
jgi:hypothetical protein